MSDNIKQVAQALSLPVLFTAWPYVNFLNHNRMESAYYGDIVTYWFVSTVIALIGVVLLKAIFRAQPLYRIAGTAAVLVALFFNFLTIADILAGFGVELRRTQLAFWLAIFVVGGGLTWQLIRSRRAVVVLVVVAGVMIAVPLAQFAMFHAAAANVETTAAPADGGATTTTTGIETARRPNVYWFLLDAYMRADKLQSSLNLDTSKFLNYLRGREFFVAEKSSSNYPGTYISLSSTLNMKYWVTETNQGFDRDPYGHFGNKSEVVNRFRKLGYRFLHAEPSTTRFTRCDDGEDLCIRGKGKGLIPVSDVEVTLLKLTPIYYLQRRLWPGLIGFAQLEVEDVMKGLRSTDLSPFFLFAHVLSPHPPPRYFPDCRPREIWSTDLVMKGGDEAKEWYAADVQCINIKMMAALDHILATDKTDPIIILQGDHGYIFRLYGDTPYAGWKTEHIEESLAILNAWRLPTTCRRHLYPTISPVNTFRLVLACIEGREPELLTDRSYMASWTNRKLMRVFDK